MVGDCFTMEEQDEPPVLCKQSRDLVVRLRKYFAQELQNGGPLLPLPSILERVADALRLDIDVVEDIDREYVKQKMKADLRKKITEDEKRNVQSIIIHTNEFYKENPKGTREELVKSLEEAGLFSGAYSALHELLVHSSYRIVKQQAKKIFKPTATITSGTGDKYYQGSRGLSFAQCPTQNEAEVSTIVNTKDSHLHNKDFNPNQEQANDYEIVTSVDVKPLHDTFEEKPELTDVVDFCIDSSQIDRMIKNTILDKPDLMNSVEKIIQKQEEEYDSESTLSADPEDMRQTSFDENSQTHKNSHNYNRVETMFNKCVENNVLNTMSVEKEVQTYQNNLKVIVKHINEFYSKNRTASHDDLLRSLKQDGIYDGSYSTLFTMVLQNSSYKDIITKKYNPKRSLAKRNKVCEMINSDHEYVPEKMTYAQKIVQTNNKTYREMYKGKQLLRHPNQENYTNDKNRYSIKRSDHLEPNQSLARRNKVCEMINSDHNYVAEKITYGHKILWTNNKKYREMYNGKQLLRHPNQSTKNYTNDKNRYCIKRSDYLETMGSKVHKGENSLPTNIPVLPLQPTLHKRKLNKVIVNIDKLEKLPAPPLQTITKVYSDKNVFVKEEPTEFPENNCMQVDELIDLADIMDDTAIKHEFNTFDECLEIEDSETLHELFN